MCPSLPLKDLDYSPMSISGWKVRNANKYYCGLSAESSRKCQSLGHHLTCLPLPKILECVRSPGRCDAPATAEFGADLIFSRAGCADSLLLTGRGQFPVDRISVS